MKSKVWIPITIILVVVLAYLLYRNSKGARAPPPPMVKSVAPGEVIVLREGNTNTTETYMSMPYQDYCFNENQPEWCKSVDKTAEMNYVYDLDGGSMDLNGQMKTTFNGETGLCADGTRDCIYTEQLDENRVLRSIMNDKGEHMIKKLVEDLWSGKLVIPDEVIRQYREMIIKKGDRFYLKRGDKVLEIISGNVQSPIVTDTTFQLPGGMVLFTMIMYYKVNDLPKPTIQPELRSEKTMGRVIGEFMQSLEQAGAQQSRPPPEAGGVRPSVNREILMAGPPEAGGVRPSVNREIRMAGPAYNLLGVEPTVKKRQNKYNKTGPSSKKTTIFT